MDLENFWLTMKDQQEVYIQKWSHQTDHPKAIIQLSHGMAEHIERYDEFASFLVRNGFFVYGNDHRGHGKTGETQGRLGYFSDELGFEKTTDDLIEITKYIQMVYPNVPIILLGHSMGSFLARRYIQKNIDLLSGVILSGTGSYPQLITKIGVLIAKIEIRNKGKTIPSKRLNNIAFGAFNKPFKDGDTAFDWLSRDKQQVSNFVEDPYTGFTPTTGFFYDLFDGIDKIHNRKLMRNIPRDLPMLFISGDKDPVGAQSIGVKKVISQYEKVGISNITSHFYKDGRHEMLNEINRQEVFEDVLNWINRQI
ncbi:alpha/beta hydrolase [Aquibacillus rhizosphaerae]|uniref:Lysophospholipase n=1 Tax=Aquibacillus rhizosphaerae TaxID=3051431 RepID=A0ABT7L0F9_9BACI|nr:alpha/beta hydrolase [Aquibacillus sp. LR5S19]MDL4839313.1 lysophospholipase [Aquibacillus sp. LR5S19]